MASFSAGSRATGQGFVASCVTLAAMLAATHAQGQTTYYWDTNGNTSGFGTASGTWGASSFLSTNASGTVATSLVTTTLSDDLNFGTATSSMGLATGTISVSGSQSIRALVFGSQSGVLTLSGGTIGLVASGTIMANQASNTNTIDSILAGATTGLVKNGVGTAILSQANTYSGSTSVTAGTLRLGGANGSILASGNIGVTGATFTLDNTTSNSNDRLGSTATVALNADSTLLFNGNGTTGSTTESFGTLGFGGGQATVTLANTGASQLQTLSATSASRAAGGVGLIRGTSLQTASTNSTRLTIGGTAGTGLSFVGSGTSAVGTSTAGTDKTLRVVPYLVGDTSATGNGSSFLTYDAHATAFGLRPLATNEYTTLTAGYTTPTTVENVNAFNGTITTASPTVNSLRFPTASQTLDGSGTLTINSGAILARANATAIGSGFSGVALGNGTWNEGVIQVVSGNTFTVNAPITVTGGGGLTKGLAGVLTLNAANTYSGDTAVSGGLLTLGTSGLLGNGSYAAAVRAVGTATLVFNNSGNQTFNGLVSSDSTIQVNGSGSTTFTGGLTSTDTLTLNAPGAVSISGGLTTSAGVTVGANAGTATISGPWTNGGTITVPSGKTLSYGSGTFTAPLPQVISGGTFAFTSGSAALGFVPMGTSVSLTVNGNGSVVQSGGIVSASGGQALRLGSNGGNGSYTITGGTLALTGSQSGGAAFVIAHTNGANATSGTLTIDGDSALVSVRSTGGVPSITWSGGGSGESRGTLNLARGELQYALESVNSGTGVAPTPLFNFGGPSGTATIRPVSGNNLTLSAAITRTLVGSNGVISSSDGDGLARSVTVNGVIGELGGSRGLSFAGSGTTTVTGTSTYSGTTWLKEGTLRTSSTTPFLNSPLEISAGATFVTGTSGVATYSLVGLSGSGTVSLGGNALTVGGNNASSTYAGVITGASGGFVKLGTGTLALTGASTLTGTLTAGEGVVSVATIGGTAEANPLGQGTVGLGTGASVGTLRYTGEGETSARQFVLSGSAGGGGAIEANGSGPLVLTGAVTAATGNKTLTLAGWNAGDNSVGAIGNPSGGNTSLVKTGAGRWVLSGSSSYGGTTTVEQGTLVLAASAVNTISGSGTLGTNTNGVTIGSPTGSGVAALLLNENVTVGARTITIPAVVSGSQAVVLGGANTSGASTFNNGVGFVLGRDVTLQAATGGTVNFNNTWTDGTGRNVTIGSAGNAGTVQLGSALSVTGAVSVTTGTLRLAAGGSISDPASMIVGTAGSSGAVLDVTPQTGSYTFGSAQTLGGIGTLQLDADTPVTIAGLFSPGNSPGLFTFDGSGTTTLSNATLMEISGTARGVTDGYDAVDLTNGSSLVLGGALELWFGSAFDAGETFNLFTLTGSGLSGNFTSVSMSGSTAAYAGLTWSESAGVWNSTSTESGQSLRFSPADGTLVVVPEPATLALAAVGIGLGGWAARRRRK